MNDLLRQTLKQIVDQYGEDACLDPRRCEALLRDLAAGHKREIFVLVSALEEGIVDDLRATASQLPFSVILPRLTTELHETTALSEDAARWAVETWAEALELATMMERTPPPTGTYEPQPTATSATIQVSDLDLVRAWQAHDGEAAAVAFSTDGRQLASVGVDAVARVWDVAGGQERASLKQQTGILTSVAWHPDGLTLALGSGDTGIYLWHWFDPGREVPRLRGHAAAVTGLVFSRDGQSVISSSRDATIRLWDVETAETRTTLQGHTSAVLDLALSPDGRRLASAGGWDRTVRVWDLDQGQEIWALTGHTAQVTCVSYAPKGRRIASGGWDEVVRLWDVAQGREQWSFVEQEDAPHMISSIAFGPVKQLLAAGDWNAEVRLWHVGQRAFAGSLVEPEGRVQSVAFSPGGRFLAAADEMGQVYLWRINGSGKSPA